MKCSQEKVELIQDNGIEVGFKKCDCPLVLLWKDKYQAKPKTRWNSPNGDIQIWDDGVLPGFQYEKMDDVWMASSLNLGAYDQAYNIMRFVHTDNAKEYKEIRQMLLGEGYPENVLDMVLIPK